MHGNDTAALALEQVAALAVQASVARAAQVVAVATFVARSRAALGPAPDDRFGLEAMDHAEARYAVVAELAARLVITELAADKLVRLALALTTRLPVTCAAFVEGRIDQERAAVVAHETELLDDAHAAVVDEVLAEHLGPNTTSELRAVVKHEVEGVDHEAVRRRAKKATAERHVRFKALGDGNAELTITAPAIVLVPAYNNIEALAKDKDRPGGRVDPFAHLIHDGAPPVGPDGNLLDQRSAGAHRADVAVDLLTQGLGDSVPSGCGPQVFVTLPAGAGLSDEPAQLDRAGTTPAIFVRHLLRDHRFRRVLTHPVTGNLVGVDGHSFPAGTLPDLSHGPQPRDDGPHPALVDDDATPGQSPTATRAADGDHPGPAEPSQRLAPTTVAPPTSAARRVRADPGHVNPQGAPGGTSTPVPVPDPVVPDPVVPDPVVPDPVNPEPLNPEPLNPATPAPPPPTPDTAHPASGCPVAAAGGGRYEPAAALLRFVRARSRRCTAPGCRRPSPQCDVDHRVPWPQGPTCPCNLAPLCRRHHLAKHRFGWVVRKASPDPADPSQHWTSPLGHEYVVPAEPFLPGHRAGALARERGVPTDPWPGDSVELTQPYGRGRADWLGTANARQANLALEQFTEAHAPPPEPATGSSPPNQRPGSGRRGDPREGLDDEPRDDPPF